MEVDELAAVYWLDRVTLEGAEEPVRVVFDSREGHQVFVRQVDPVDGDPPRIPLHPGDVPVLMEAVLEAGVHTTGEVGRSGDLLARMRVIPLRREPGRVFARTLRRGEPDDGTRVHVRPGDQLVLEEITAELDAIDDVEQAAATGYTPLTPALWTWLQLGDGRSGGTVRYLLAAARRLDAAAALFKRLEPLRADAAREDLTGFATRRALFDLIGTVETAVVALGRAVDMAARAQELIGTAVVLPPAIMTKQEAVKVIRNAYEHIEDRALGTVRNKPDPQALMIFDHQRLIEDDVITYAQHTLDLASEVPALLADTRQYLKDVAGNI